MVPVFIEHRFNLLGSHVPAALAGACLIGGDAQSLAPVDIVARIRVMAFDVTMS
jgi:hypothetical protein